MSAITFDTLKLARKLEQAGFTREQAAGAAEAFSEALADGLVTKSDLQSELAPVGAKLAVLKAELAIVKWMVSGIGFGVLLLVLRNFWPG